MRKALSIILTAVLVLLCLTSCSEVSNDKLGTLEININSSVSRGMQAISMETACYNVVVKNSSEEIVASIYRDTRTSYSASLPAGTYLISVEALNSTGDVIGTGSCEATIVAGQTNSFSVTVSETEGNGTFSMAITAEAGHSFTYTIETAAGSTVTSGNLTYSEGVYSASETLPNGYYTFLITTESDKVVKFDSIRIIANKVLTYSAEFLFLNNGSVTITNEIVQNPAIAITLSTRLPKVGNTLTASATISGIPSGYSCYWTLDGTVQGVAGDYADFEYEIPASSEGSHEIALFVSKENIIWSESVGFEVISARPTELEISGDVEMWLVGDVLIPWDLGVDWTVGNYQSGTFKTSGHRVLHLDSVPQTLSCTVNYPDYQYYLKSEFDDVNNRTVVYIVIDKYIENPAYIAFDMEKGYQMGNNQRFGCWIRSTNNDIESTVSSNRRNMGLIPFTNNNGIRLIKVAPDTYRFENSTNSSNMPDWFYVVFDKSSLNLSAGETKTITASEGEASSVTVQFPDSYVDGTEFYVENMYRNRGYIYKVEDGNIVIKYNPSQKPSMYLLYQLEDKNCYYTVSPDSSSVTATKHEAAFVNTGVSIPDGGFIVNCTADCLIPADMKIQLRVGNTYTYRGGIPMGGYDGVYYSNAGGSLYLFATLAEGYSISASTQEFVFQEEHVTLITVSISATYGDYSTLNMSYDFDFNLDQINRTAVSLSKDNSNVRYYLPVVDKNVTAIKALPGYYRYDGCWNGIDTEAGMVYPYSSPNSFTVGANESVTVSVEMELD